MSILDTVNNVTDGITRIIQPVTVLIFGCFLLFVAWGYYTADTAISEISETAEAMHERQIAAEERYTRERTLAKDDWGSGTSVSNEYSSYDDDSYADDWGTTD